MNQYINVSKFEDLFFLYRFNVINVMNMINFKILNYFIKFKIYKFISNLLIVIYNNLFIKLNSIKLKLLNLKLF